MVHTASTRRRTPGTRPAPTDVDIHPLIAGRWSPRAMADTPVEPGRLRAVLEAARWAPSSFNEQPWRFLVATSADRKWLEELGSYLLPGNAWALAAPVLVASAYRTTLSRNGRDNRMALRDLGAAEQNAALEAVHQGLVMHQMAGFDAERLRDDLLPEGFEAGSMWALGHPGDPADLSEEKRAAEEAERTRKPLDGVAFEVEWGRTAGFLE